MADHKHGTMNIRAHEKAFTGLIKGAVVVSAIAVIVLIILAFVGT